MGTVLLWDMGTWYCNACKSTGLYLIRVCNMFTYIQSINKIHIKKMKKVIVILMLAGCFFMTKVHKTAWYALAASLCFTAAIFVDNKDINNSKT